MPWSWLPSSKQLGPEQLRSRFSGYGTLFPRRWELNIWFLDTLAMTSYLQAVGGSLQLISRYPGKASYWQAAGSHNSWFLDTLVWPPICKQLEVITADFPKPWSWHPIYKQLGVHASWFLSWSCHPSSKQLGGHDIWFLESLVMTSYFQTAGGHASFLGTYYLNKNLLHGVLFSLD